MELMREKKVDAWKAERSNVEIDLWLEDCPYDKPVNIPKECCRVIGDTNGCIKKTLHWSKC